MGSLCHRCVRWSDTCSQLQCTELCSTGQWYGTLKAPTRCQVRMWLNPSPQTAEIAPIFSAPTVHLKEQPSSTELAFTLFLFTEWWWLTDDDDLLTVWCPCTCYLLLGNSNFLKHPHNHTANKLCTYNKGQQQSQSHKYKTADLRLSVLLPTNHDFGPTCY